jgi:anti-sigma B factor antagonist
MDDILDFKFNDDSGLRLKSSIINGDSSSLLVTLEGYLDTNNSIQFTDAFIKSIDKYEKAKTVVVDMEKVTYVSSTGIGSFVAILSHFKKKNYTLYILKINEKVRSVFDLLGFTSYFDFIGDAKEVQTGMITQKKTDLVGTCPSCGKKFKLAHAGRFKCPSCGGTIVV